MPAHAHTRVHAHAHVHINTRIHTSIRKHTHAVAHRHKHIPHTSPRITVAHGLLCACYLHV